LLSISGVLLKAGAAVGVSVDTNSALSRDFAFSARNFEGCPGQLGAVRLANDEPEVEMERAR
jgi:hypothetical protein